MSDEADEPIDLIIADYLRRVETGQQVDRERLLAEHPELAEPLRDFFADRDRFDVLTQSLGRRRRRAAPAPDQIRRFGDFELLEEIAQGGMGVVYKARQLSLNRTVAVKMILAGRLASADDLKRFQTEAEAAAGLDHPNIVKIHEVGDHEGYKYFSMDYIDGENLAERMHRRQLATTEAVDVMATAARAIHYAHQQGTLHRDLKPSNILLDRHGAVRITDFGLAKQASSSDRLTITGQVIGTPSYMPPEQARGRLEGMGPAADVYSLGAILYELITGRPPFRGETTFETIRLVIDEAPVSVRLLNPKVPRDLGTICHKCLEKEADRRYATAEQLADDLDRFRRHEPIVARPIGAAGRVWRWCKRRPMIASLAAALVVTFVAGFAGTALQWREADRNFGDAVIARDEAIAAKEEAESLQVSLGDALAATREAAKSEAEAHHNTRVYLYVANMNLINSAWEVSDQPQIEALLNQLRPGKGEDDVRGFEWHYWNRQAHREAATLRDGRDLWTATFVGDGSIAATIGNRRGESNLPKLWNVDAGKPIGEMPKRQVGLAGAGASADGGVLATVDRTGDIGFWRLPSFDSISTNTTSHGIAAASFLFSARNRYAAYVYRDVKSIILRPPAYRASKPWTVYDVQAGTQQFSLPGGAVQIVFMPDEKTLLAFGAEGDVEAWDVVKKERTELLIRFDRPASAAVAAPDGQTLAIGGVLPNESDVALFDMQSRKVQMRLSAHDGPITSVAFAPSGALLATGGGDRTIRLWRAASGRLAATLRGHAAAVNHLAFSNDGRKLISTGSGDGIAKVWTLSDVLATPGIEFSGASVSGLSFSGDGRRLAVATGERAVRIVDVAARAEQAPLSTGLSAALGVSWSPDNRRLVVAGKQRHVELLDVNTGRTLFDGRMATPDATPRPILFASGDVPTIAYAANGSTWLSSFEGEGIAFFDDQGRRFREMTVASRLPVARFSLSGDGQTIAFVDRDGAIRLRRVDGSSADTILPKQSLPATVMALSPDGSRLAANRGPSIGFWDVKTKTMYSSVRAHDVRVRALAFSPDGKTLASGGDDDRVRLWNVESGQPTTSLLGHAAAVRCLAFSPDGKTLASSDASGQILFWDASTDAPAPSETHATTAVSP